MARRPIDPEVNEVVNLLRGRGVETFSSCSGMEGHTWNYPMVRCRPRDPVWLFGVLTELGYNGFYVKEYRSAHVGPQVEFIEIEFWSLDCLDRRTIISGTAQKENNKGDGAMNRPTREDAIQLILTEVHKGYTIDEAVKRLTTPPQKEQSKLLELSRKGKPR